jgi:hypothetical protein
MYLIKTIISAVSLILLAAALVNAATITVANTNDGGAGSLRQAISDAVSGDTIDFNLSGCPCTIALTSAELLIDRKNLFINGPGANQLTISGSNSRRVFRLTGTSPALVTMFGVTIANGNTAQNGGGIYVQTGKLTLSNSIVTGNVAPTNGINQGYGGGIMVDPNSSLNVINSTITGNSSVNSGGGIGTLTTNGFGANVTIVNSAISNNSGRFGGGVFISTTSTLTSSNTNFTNNAATVIGGGILNQGSAKLESGMINLNDVTGAGGEGGGISNEGTLDISKVAVTSNASTAIGGGIHNTGPLSIADSTISGNQTVSGGGINNTNNLTVASSAISGNIATGDGGGINNLGTLNLNNSTISGNQANAFGGGINNANNSTTNLSNSTVAFNSTTFRGGGIFNNSTGTAFNVQNTIIALNTATNQGPNGLGTFVSQGFNLIGNVVNNGQFVGFTNGTNGDIVGGGGQPVVDPLLNPLADNGGPTQTHALQPMSPAIDKGDSGFGTVKDQRGNARFVDAVAAPNIAGGDFSDIGAFEFAAPTAASVRVAGRALTSEKRGLANARVILIDSDGNIQSAATSSFGYFRFPDVEVGETYVLLVRSKSYQFAPQIITIKDEIADLNLIAIP